VLHFASEFRWLNEIAIGNGTTPNAPEAWSDWMSKGRYKALTSESTTVIRSKDAQTPDASSKVAILAIVWDHFKDAPRAFEAFAARIFQMHDPRVIIDESRVLRSMVAATLSAATFSVSATIRFTQSH
jgi:hypothetical protein